MKKKKKVFVSGCFDCFHSGHAEFLRKAGEYGELYVAAGSDKNIKRLKEIHPTFNEKERKFILESIKGVRKVFISKGLGKIDFLNELDETKPDLFIVNEDGHTQEKKLICEKRGIKYIILKRAPKKGLPPRSSTELRAKNSKLPYRIDLAGGWLDQPYISKYYPGNVLTISIEPEEGFNFRSGMASSTRNKAIKIWKDKIPKGNLQDIAKILFSFENPPGTNEKEIAGAQDSIGIVYPGIACSYFEGKYWPTKIIHKMDESLIRWLEKIIYLVELKPRKEDYDVFKNSNITKKTVRDLAYASKKCFEGLLEKDFDKFAEGFLESFEAQTELFPATCPQKVRQEILDYKKRGAKAWKLSGAGGGGYLILISNKNIKGARKIKIRRN